MASAAERETNQGDGVGGRSHKRRGEIHVEYGLLELIGMGYHQLEAWEALCYADGDFDGAFDILNARGIEVSKDVSDRTGM